MTQLHTIGLVVNDLSKTLKFYRTLGLDIPDGLDNEFHVEFTDKNGFSIGFIPKTTMKKTDPTWKNHKGSGRISLQFQVASPESVDTTYNSLISEGHAAFKAPWDAFWGQRFAQVLDPDGNNIGIFAPLKNEQ
jgi:catechol 2,3-dioxygenase-like lactoylglutathione lyase family enzyme